MAERKSNYGKGHLTVEKVAGRSAATSVFATYPLKLILPNKIASPDADAVWAYLITYGGGILSGDSISCTVDVGDDSTLILTTQASTKVYKSTKGLVSEQGLQASVGRHATLALLPDPVTCFAHAKYKQQQLFNISPDANLVLVDWLTSGRHACGEVWEFESYRSSNEIYIDGEPIMLDKTYLEQGEFASVGAHLQGFHVVTMVAIYGSQFLSFQQHMQKKVNELTQAVLKGSMHKRASERGEMMHLPRIFASCSTFGPKDSGLIVRLVARNTESVYDFLKQELELLAPQLGAVPYSGR